MTIVMGLLLYEYYIKCLEIPILKFVEMHDNWVSKSRELQSPSESSSTRRQRRAIRAALR